MRGLAGSLSGHRPHKYLQPVTNRYSIANRIEMQETGKEKSQVPLYINRVLTRSYPHTEGVDAPFWINLWGTDCSS